MKKGFKWLLGILIFIVLLAMALTTGWGSETVSSVTGWAGDKIRSVARTVVLIGLGLFLVSIGAGMMAVAPVVGIVCIAVGLALVAWGVWPLFRKPSVGNTSTNMKTY